MQHVVHRPIDVDVVGDVVADELEIAIAQVRDVGKIAGQQVVDADHGVATVEQGLREMRTNETRRAGNDDSRHMVSIVLRVERVTRGLG